MFRPRSLLLCAALLSLAPIAPAAATQGPWNFYFAYGSDRPLDLSAQSLHAFAVQARAAPLPLTILVSGFVDGSEATRPGNRRLACRRAQAIVRQLVREGMSRGRFLLYAGDDRATMPMTPGLRDPGGRRVEFAFHPDPAAARAAATGRPC